MEMSLIKKDGITWTRFKVSKKDRNQQIYVF